jgi:hypothetical protein
LPNTRKMQWPYPNKDSDPWFDRFDSMVTAQDASGYASREDRHARISGGGVVSFDAAGGAFSWSEDIEILSPISGFKIIVPADSLVVEDGESVVVDVTRSPTSNVVAAAYVAGNTPNTDNAYTILVRSGSSVYLANGSSVADGESISLFGGTPPGTSFVEIVKLSDRLSHNSATPLVGGAVSFNPSDHNKPGLARTLSFRATAAIGDLANDGVVKLVNVTDGDEIASLTFSSTSIVKNEVVLVEGAGAGEVDLLDKIYEVRISLAAPSGGPSETIELYGAEIRVVSTPA